VPLQPPGHDEIPEPPLGGRHVGFVLAERAADGGERVSAGMKQRKGAAARTEMGGAKDRALARGQRGVQVLAAANLD